MAGKLVHRTQRSLAESVQLDEAAVLLVPYSVLHYDLLSDFDRIAGLDGLLDFPVAVELAGNLETVAGGLDLREGH